MVDKLGLSLRRINNKQIIRDLCAQLYTVVLKRKFTSNQLIKMKRAAMGKYLLALQGAHPLRFQYLARRQHLDVLRY